MSRTNSLNQCEKLVSFFSNRSIPLSEYDDYPPYIHQLILKKNSSINSNRSLENCLYLFEMMENSSIEWRYSHRGHDDDDRSIFNDYSTSLIVFILLITLVSLVSIVGNLVLAKILYSKRDRLVQTDRIVLCLALSELCLVLIDSPIEIYRFLSYSFTIDWLCRFHTFFESLFSSCIIFYHLLGAFDRFVYLHGNISRRNGRWAKFCQYLSTRSGSILLLFVPLILSIPISICNCFHSNIIYTSTNNKICVVQYNHRLLISLLVSFYLIPLICSFILHGKLIYLICKRHEQIDSRRTSMIIPLKKFSSNEEEKIRSRRNRLIDEQELRSPSTTTTTMANLLQTRSSSNRRFPRSKRLILYKINSQANANANRTILLLVLLLSFYVFCWAPHNIYTWYHAYQLTHRYSTGNSSFIDEPLNSSHLQSNLRRIIFINYSLYLLSMVSMCFSFSLYFTLNKQGRMALIRSLAFICPKLRYEKNSSRENRFLQQFQLDDQQLRSPNRNRRSTPLSRQQQQQKPKENLCRPLTHFDRSPQRFVSHQQIQLNYPKKIYRNYQFQIQCCP